MKFNCGAIQEGPLSRTRVSHTDSWHCQEARRKLGPHFKERGTEQGAARPGSTGNVLANGYVCWKLQRYRLGKH